MKNYEPVIRLMNGTIARAIRCNYGLGLYYIFRNKRKEFILNGCPHRVDGPDEINGKSRYWSYRGLEKTGLVIRWCTLRGVDIEDMSETELLIMWGELEV